MRGDIWVVNITKFEYLIIMEQGCKTQVIHLARWLMNLGSNPPVPQFIKKYIYVSLIRNY